MDVPVRDATGASVGTIALDDRVFGIEPNLAVLHQAVVAQQANMRQGTANTLTRAQVRGGGKKPWRQKGTGRARAGSTRAPHWRGGGAAFAPRTQFGVKVNRKTRRAALRGALSSHAANGTFGVLDGATFDEPSTAQAIECLTKW